MEPTLQTCQHQQRRRRTKTATLDDGRARDGLLGIGLTGRARSLPVAIRPPMPVQPQNHTKRMNDCTHDLSINRTERNIFTTHCVLPARRCAASAPRGTKNGATWAGVRPSSTLLVRRKKPERVSSSGRWGGGHPPHFPRGVRSLKGSSSPGRCIGWPRAGLASCSSTGREHRRCRNTQGGVRSLRGYLRPDERGAWSARRRPSDV